MKLFEQLDKMKEDQIVAIGAQGGNGFIYIGEAGNRELIEKCFDDCRRKIENNLAKNKEKLEGYFVEPVQMVTEYKVDLLMDLRNKCYAIEKTTQTIISNINYINGYVKPEERGVMEVYHKEVDDCMAIIIKGSESGGFWTKEEFDKKYKK